MSNSLELEITERRLPHWHLEGSVYFITFRLAQGDLTSTERAIVLQHIRSGHERFYVLYSAVVMPDHVHVIIKPNSGVDLSRIMKGMKGVSARLLNEARGTKGTIWQDESYDRIIRDDKEFIEKLEYLLMNPVKANLANDGREYDGWYIDKDACFRADKNVCPTNLQTPLQNSQTPHQ